MSSKRPQLLARMWRYCSYTDGGNISWCSHYGKQYGGFSKKLEIELLYNPAITLLGVYLERQNKNTNSKRYMHSNIYSSIIYNSQDMKATTDEWIKKLWYMHISSETPIPILHLPSSHWFVFYIYL